MSDQKRSVKRRFQVAESAARSGVILLGAGVTAFFIGGLIASGLAVRVLEREGAIESPFWGFVFGWVLQRVWLWLVLPPIGWVVGRFLLRVKPLDFAITAALTGEAFGIALASGINGTDFLFVDAADVVVRVVTLVLGMGLTKLAVDAGRDSNTAAQAQADALAAARKAEYADFVARAADGSQQPPAP